MTHRHATVRFGAGCHLGPGFSLWLPGGGAFVVGTGVQFRRNFVCEIGERGRVTIGDGCVFTYDTVIQCSTSVDIGPECYIGRVLVADGNHRFRDPDLSLQAQGFDFRPIQIGAQTLITTNATVTHSIGRRCVIGAGAVVVDPIPDFSLAVGAPARVVEQYGPDVGPTAGAPPSA